MSLDTRDTLNGLKRKPAYEEVLNLAVKDANSQHNLLSVGMQRFATEAINNPLFQRVKATMEQDMETEQKAILDQKTFETNLTRLSVEARVSKDDLSWLVQNLQQPPPPPPPPSNNASAANEARIDYDRIAAEMDAVMQRRNVETSHKALAAEVREALAAQAVATPAQQIIQNHHQYFITQPPPPVAPPQPNISSQARHTGKSVHELFLAQQQQQPQQQQDIPITYFDPPTRLTSQEFPAEMMRPPGIVEASSMGKSKPITKFDKGKKNKPADTPKKPKALVASSTTEADTPSPPPPPASYPSTETAIVPQQRRRPYRSQDVVPPVAGVMQLKIPTHSTIESSDSIRDAAKQKMLAIADRKRQESTRKTDFQKLVENEKKRRRGGAPGDVVEPGKRTFSQRDPDMPRSILRKPAPVEGPARKRQMLYGPRTQVFNMDQAVTAY